MNTQAEAIFDYEGAVTDAQRAQFERDGYLAFRHVLSPAQIADARQALTELVGEFARQSQEQRDQQRMKVQFEFGFEPAPGEQGDPGDLELRVRKYMWFHDRKPVLTEIAYAGHPVYDIVSALIGQGSTLFQDMALVKPPLIGSEKAWHQDNAYFAVTPLESVCGVWIALDDATVENGCMHVLPGGHKGGAQVHYHGPDSDSVKGLNPDRCQIRPGQIATSEAVPVPIPAGGAMFFYGMLPHQTPPNTSPGRRRALQYHFRSAESQIIPTEEYFQIFAAADGTPASCKAAMQSGI